MKRTITRYTQPVELTPTDNGYNNKTFKKHYLIEMIKQPDNLIPDLIPYEDRFIDVVADAGYDGLIESIWLAGKYTVDETEAERIKREELEQANANQVVDMSQAANKALMIKDRGIVLDLVRRYPEYNLTKLFDDLDRKIKK